MAAPRRKDRRTRSRSIAARARSPRRRRKQHEVTVDFTDPAVARRWRRGSLLAISLGAGVGITWYVLAPSDTSYQVGYTLALPGIITAIVWVGRRLPRWLDWVIAVALGAGGSIGYVVFDGSQWWLWAQLGLLPFVLLVLITGTKPSADGQRKPEQWYGGMQDGPWGPP